MVRYNVSGTKLRVRYKILITLARLLALAAAFLLLHKVTVHSLSNCCLQHVYSVRNNKHHGVKLIIDRMSPKNFPANYNWKSLVNLVHSPFLSTYPSCNEKGCRCSEDADESRVYGSLHGCLSCHLAFEIPENK
jgi:hypothetical protein